MTEIFNKEQPASDLLMQIWHMVGKSNFQVRSIFCRMLRWVEVVGKVGWHANDNKGERGHIIDKSVAVICMQEMLLATSIQGKTWSRSRCIWAQSVIDQDWKWLSDIQDEVWSRHEISPIHVLQRCSLTRQFTPALCSFKDANFSFD